MELFSSCIFVEGIRENIEEKRKTKFFKYFIMESQVLILKEQLRVYNGNKGFIMVIMVLEDIKLSKTLSLEVQAL